MQAAILEVRDLHYAYPDGQPALQGLGFVVEPGETIGLVGPNGAGKSTLLLHLNGILPERPASTESGAAVRIDGTEVVASNLHLVRRSVGLMFQNPDDQLFCPTVIEDVAFGPLNQGRPAHEARRIAAEALASVGMTDFDDRPPHHLSMGERKRVCLAGVLACRPEILALDEPTGNLDPRGRRRFMELLRTLPMTKIVATHDLEMVCELCTRVLILDEGRLCADGGTREVLTQEALLERHGLEMPLSLKIERKQPS